MSYEFSWNILEDTFDNISDVLGNTMSDNHIGEEVMDHGACEELMGNIVNENMNHSNMEETNSDYVKVPNTTICEKIEEASEELFPVGRSRSNSWPRRKLQRFVRIVLNILSLSLNTVLAYLILLNIILRWLVRKEVLRRKVRKVSLLSKITKSFM